MKLGRILSFLLCLVLLFNLAPVYVVADNLSDDVVADAETEMSEPDLEADETEGVYDSEFPAEDEETNDPLLQDEGTDFVQLPTEATINVVFLSDKPTDLSCLHVYDYEGLEVEPIVDESNASYIYGNYALVPGSYSFLYHDDSQIFEDVRNEFELVEGQDDLTITLDLLKIEEAVPSDEDANSTDDDKLDEVEAPAEEPTNGTTEKTTQVCFTSENTVNLSNVKVFNSDGVEIDPCIDEESSSFIYGTYALTEGDYTYRYHDSDGLDQDIEGSFHVDAEQQQMTINLRSSEDTMSFSEIFINPIYAGLVSEADIEATIEDQNAQESKSDEDASKSTFSSISYTNPDSLAAAIKPLLISRNTSLEFNYTTWDDFNVKGSFGNLFWDAISRASYHNLVPNEGDYIRFNVIGFGGSWSRARLSSGMYEYNIQLQLVYATSAVEEYILESRVRSIISSLSLNGKSDYQKVYSIYKYITDNVVYDYAHVKDDSYYPQYGAYAALVDGICVCQGYANAFYRLCLYAGVDSRIVAGNNHAWNICNLYGDYYEVDSTWDAERLSWEYFLRGTNFWNSDGKHGLLGNLYDTTPVESLYNISSKDFDINKVLSAPKPSISKSNGAIKLSWAAVPGASKYWIYRSTDGVNYSRISTFTGTTYINSSISRGVKYYYIVKAVDSSGRSSDFSNVKSAVILSTPTPAISKSNGAIKLSWAAVPGASKYWIYRSTDGVNYSRISTFTGTTYVNSSILNGVKYYYKVKAVATVGGNDWSSDFSAVKSSIILSTPRPAISKSNGSIKLSWAAVPGASKYWIYRSTDGVNYSRISTFTGTTYVNTSVSNGVTYYYKVKAVATVGGNDWSSNYSSVKSSIILSAPRLIRIYHTEDGIATTFSTSPGASSYLVYRSTDGVNFTQVSLYAYTQKGVRYYYKIKAAATVDGNRWTSDFSNVMSIIA